MQDTKAVTAYGDKVRQGGEIHIPFTKVGLFLQVKPIFFFGALCLLLGLPADHPEDPAVSSGQDAAGYCREDRHVGAC